MIRILLPLFNCYEFVENFDSLLLIIENKKVLYNFLKDLLGGCLQEENIQLFDENNKHIKNSDYIDFAPSIFDIDVNNKKNINALIKFIKKTCYENIKEATTSIEETLKKSFDFLKLEIPLDVIDNIDINEDDYFKLLDIKIIDDDINLLERITTYIKTSFELRSIKIFVFYGLFSLLEGEEVRYLLKECQYLDVKIINIEHSDISTNCFSNKIILDKDICLLK